MARQKEIQNFERYNVFEEVMDEGQLVLGTQFVLTEKANGSLKARFVIKGFQEENHQLESQTTSRNTLKVFCSVTANEKGPVTGSDIQAAFLQSDSLDREVFVKHPPENKKEGYVWKLLKPAYGLRDASSKWFGSFIQTLKEFGMQQNKRDSSKKDFIFTGHHIY